MCSLASWPMCCHSIDLAVMASSHAVDAACGRCIAHPPTHPPTHPRSHQHATRASHESSSNAPTSPLPLRTHLPTAPHLARVPPAHTAVNSVLETWCARITAKITFRRQLEGVAERPTNTHPPNKPNRKKITRSADRILPPRNVRDSHQPQVINFHHFVHALHAQVNQISVTFPRGLAFKMSSSLVWGVRCCGCPARPRPALADLSL
jgi:hypothetical protein